jgi:RHS repeat-associated protein
VTISGSNSFQDDANGNQTTRVIGADTFTLFYDAENRLIQVKKNNIEIASFVFDGNGNRVQSTLSGTTTTFVGSHYEVTGSTITKYYFAGGSRIAMRKYTIPQSMTVEYLFGDHLASTGLTADTAGAKVSEMKYKPWGEIRYSWTAGISTTPAYKLPSYSFTGQFSYMDDPSTSGVIEGFGLMFYNARWYDPYINHFTQPDTIVPNPYNSQDWDRYAFVRNNPVRYTDPSGHCINGTTGDVNMGESPAGTSGICSGTMPPAQTPTSSPTSSSTQTETNDSQSDTSLSQIFESWRDQADTAFTIALPPPLFACEWVDCILSGIGFAASVADTFAIEIPAVSGPALIVDFVATVVSTGRTNDDRAAGKISKTRQYWLNGTSWVSLIPDPLFYSGFVSSGANLVMTVTGFPP